MVTNFCFKRDNLTFSQNKKVFSSQMLNIFYFRKNIFYINSPQDLHVPSLRLITLAFQLLLIFSEDMIQVMM